MKYIEAKKLEPEEFKRLCGVHSATFEQMVKVVAVEKMLAKKSGRPNINDITVLERVSNLFPYGDRLGIGRNKCTEKCQKGRKYTHPLRDV